MLKINELLTSPRGIPFSKIVHSASTECFLSPSTYKISHGIYLSLSPFRHGSLEKDTTGPFVMGIVWAASDGALRRALIMEIESDDGAISDVPRDFLPASGASSYGKILHELKVSKPRTCLETAAYRIATDGRFIHRIIETERFAFYFRNSKNDDSEEPYVIVRKLI